MHPVVRQVTERITERSRSRRTAYLGRIEAEGFGRELFVPFRAHVSPADLGASVFAHV